MLEYTSVLKTIMLAALAVSFVSLCGYAQTAETPNGAQSDAPAASAEEDETRILDEVQVDERDRRPRRRFIPPTGTLRFEPLPVKMSGSHPIFEHAALELILRPVRLGENGIYKADNLEGVDFYNVDVELGIGRTIVGSRLPLAKDGKRTIDLPEGIYALTEVRYLVFNQIGRAFDPDDPFGNPTPIPRQDYRFCLAERTIAFDIQIGETTDIGRLIIRALEKRFRTNSRQHRPILGADAQFLSVSDPGFRNKAPEMASAAVIAFENTAPLCRESAIQAPGWYTPEELAESLPKFKERLDTE